MNRAVPDPLWLLYGSGAWGDSGVPGEDFIDVAPPQCACIHSVVYLLFRWEACTAPDHKDFHSQQ